MQQNTKLTHQYTHVLQSHKVSIYRNRPSATQNQVPVQQIKQAQVYIITQTLFW